MKFTVTNRPECISYLSLKLNDEVYSLEDFYAKFYSDKDKFFLDRHIENFTISYKTNTFSYEQLLSEEYDFSERLGFSNQYASFLYPKIFAIFATDRDYYASMNLIKSMEDQMEIARLSLMEASQILDMNINISWKTGYGPIYKIRTIRANNAILCYNNLFDYLMQIIYVAYEIYKQHSDYSSGDSFETILKRCDYGFLSEFYGGHKEVKDFKALWKILSKAQNLCFNVNRWANFLKHKGGITYIGLEAMRPFALQVKNINGTEEKDDDYSLIEVDLEEVIKELERVHSGYKEIIIELVNFMNFDKIKLQENENGIVLQSKESFKRVIF